MPKQSKKIAFHHVSFRYQKDELTITDITCTILSGQNVAFVGSSGAGKSTLLNLLMRFYDPSEGSLTLDDIDYRNFTQDSLHSVIGYVPQEPMMFNITIMENIRLGNLAATNEEIFEAAKAAEIHDDIMRMLNGYETMVGERGGRLSSGQKQRIAIARAFLRKPSIFILDEITASLDPASESAINQTIQRITKGLTCIAVTHRLSSVIKSDCIYVIQHGRMCEQGTHKELLAQNGVYKHIWEKQHGFILNYLDNNEAKITANRLSEVPIFQNVSLNILDKITTLFHTYHYEENQIVMEEGELGDLFFIIVHGQVGVYNLNKEKKDKQIAVLSDGDYFGEIALLKAVPRNATIKTMSPCILLTLRHRDFMNLLKEAPELRKKLEEKLILSQISNNHNHGIN